MSDFKTGLVKWSKRLHARIKKAVHAECRGATAANVCGYKFRTISAAQEIGYQGILRGLRRY